MEIVLPYKFEPREYQVPFLGEMALGKKRAILLWHRRAGKDKVALNFMITQMYKKVGNYFYCLPEYAQARKVIWESIGSDGSRFVDHFPPALIKSKNDHEMTIEFVNGSIFRLIGADQYNSVMGTNPVGIIFSEYSIQDPHAWGYFRPILAENDGWAIFVYTARGKNHGFNLYNMAKNNPNWYVSKLTADDTGVLSKEKLENEKKEMFADTGDDALFFQEYYLDFNAAVQGAYYSRLLNEAEAQGRFRQTLFDPAVEVETWWDLGVGDSTSVWFTQTVANEVRVIDFYESHNKGLTEYIKVIREKPYVYKAHHAPHDIQVREFTTGKTRLEVARELGIRFIIVPKLSVDDGIQAVRNILPRCIFDSLKCQKGLEALASYHKEYDDQAKTFKDRPDHDWSSHASDAFRYFAVGHKDQTEYNDPNILRSPYNPNDSW